MIKYATIQDIPALVKLEECCFSGDRLTARNFRYLLTRAKSLIWVYRARQDIIAAAILLMRKGSSHTRLYSFSVHPAYQGKGIAARLLQQVEQAITAKNYQTICLEVREDNQQAIHFYKKQAYHIIGHYQHYYEDQMNALRMEKTLSALAIKDDYDN